MAYARERHDPVRLLWRRLLAVLMLILTALMLRGVWGVYHKANEAKAFNIEAQAKLGELEKRERELRADVAALKSERGIEAELRERYGMAEDGEGVVVIVGDTSLPPAPPPPTRLQRFKNWFSW